MLRNVPYPTKGVRLVKNVLAPMRDGVVLAMDLYMPDSAQPGRFPVVMEYIPYRKDEVRSGDAFYDFFPLQGYVMARVDCRGTGASGGAPPMNTWRWSRPMHTMSSSGSPASRGAMAM